LKKYEDARNRLEKFTDKPFRDTQKSALTFLHNSDKKIRVLCAPTGCGKSLVAFSEGLQHSKFLYLCSSRQLQTQIESEFPEAKVMWGRGNFKCNAFSGLDASECPYMGDDQANAAEKRLCKLSCDYEIQKKAVLAHPFQVLNYSYFLFEGNFVGKFSDYPLIVCDEADKIESVVSKFINVRISKRLLGILRIKPPTFITTQATHWYRSWQDWAGSTKSKVDNHRGRLTKRLEYIDPSDQRYKFTKDEIQSCKSLLWKLDVFIENMDETWIYETIKYRGKITAWEFKPTWIPKALMQRFFLKHGHRFIFMSATFPPVPVLCQILGLAKSDVDYCEIPSTFPVGNRRVILDGVGDLGSKTFDQDLPKVLDRINTLLNDYPNVKGVIHTVSWKLNEAVMGINNKRLVTHDSKNKDEVLDMFKKSDLPVVFVSPSSCRGIDLPGADCRFTIIAKMPFQSLGDKLVKTRVYQGNIGSYWYNSDAVQEIIQAQGRGVRSSDDYCVTYILDKQATSRVFSMRGLFPGYWLDGCEV